MTAAPPARSSQMIGCDTSPVLTGDEIVVAVVLPDVAGVDAGVFLGCVGVMILGVGVVVLGVGVGVLGVGVGEDGVGVGVGLFFISTDCSLSFISQCAAILTLS